MIFHVENFSLLVVFVQFWFCFFLMEAIFDSNLNYFFVNLSIFSECVGDGLSVTE